MTDERSTPGARYWWVGALAATVLLAVGVHLAVQESGYRPPTGDALLAAVAEDFRAQNPAVFHDFHPLDGAARTGRPGPAPEVDLADAALRERYALGDGWIRRAAPEEVRRVLRVQWAWHLDLRDFAFDLATSAKPPVSEGALLKETLAFMRRGPPEAE